MNQTCIAKDSMKTTPIPPSDGKEIRASNVAAPVLESPAAELAAGGVAATPTITASPDGSSSITEMAELCARYKRLYAGLVFDVLEHFGYANQALNHAITPISPEMKLAGPAFTFKGSTTAVKDEKWRYRRLSAIKEMKFPCVEVRDHTTPFNVALYGELSATTAAAHGAVGALIDGGTRDSGMLISMGFPVFARYRSPVEAFGRVITIEHQVPILIAGELSETVVVNPGDFIFGDIDGALVIPKELTLKVLLEAERIAGIENAARKDFKTGEDPVEVFKRHRRL
jgi:4-hydroxy-4-methyl-2-oxoglutarate aldolase